ncbi:TetR family transcriptional regulator [Patulibacter sp.]|uniref:TetR family transcriptional regulator n=1 Tax=Patulibacter sp. TaxID=1912859 RepID=UPI0027217788|nr:TetR family transcriptional regulator [Patulibacter sp.]MDO9406903.1 TetR family transcriptional regulator [Patulibacter sp.]
MSRWQPDSRRRLQEAAVELYAEHGFSETTVAAVAERAGLTERTFFRYFADKREVLFGGEDALRAALVDAVAEAPRGAGPAELADAGVGAVVRALEPRRAELRRREPIVARHPELRERELTKLASWTAALREALEARAVPPRTAAVVASARVALLAVSARRWLADDGEDLAATVAADLAALRAST